MKRFEILFTLLLWSLPALWAQSNAKFSSLPEEHPRYLTTPQGKAETWKLIHEEAWAKDVFEKLKKRTDVYVDSVEVDASWLLSRLAMYWNSHATDIYIKGETFDHAGGERAPVPTVRFTGTRGTVATHGRPRLTDVVPYDDADGNVTFHNNSLPGRPLESVHPSKTGRNIESLNREIMGIARDAAFLYWMTDDERYARLAAGVFDTYMPGIYYRGVPIDLNHGHQQTLVGMSSFEVIHEDILYEIVPLYDFLYDYLKTHYATHMDIYAGAFKKWAETIIAGGVPHNNWNLMQARYVLDIGMMLDDDAAYADGKGRQYYIDYVLNRSSIRQWSLKRLADYGYDPETGIWAECPGYSCVVLNDYSDMTSLFDRNLHYDLTQELPVLPKAARSYVQYLFPNRMICGFGDTHPGYLTTKPVSRMIENAQVNGKTEQEDYFTALLKCLDANAGKEQAKKNVRVAVSSFFDDKPLTLKSDVAAGRIEDYVSPLFYAPNVSWLVQRNGMDARHSLMISQNASAGNHSHANGLSMELYGKGYVLGPDAGIGKSSYSGLDYAEYYSQFPAHNTVCVDGISSYPIMKSNHAFDLLSCFPASAEAVGSSTSSELTGAATDRFPSVTYSNLSFREPETRADQTRLMSIVSTGAGSGYYVDVFRSRKERGGDKMHDYFYHNLGQVMSLTATDGSSLNLQPTEELAFAGAHLYAYSYLFDKKSASTDKDVKATFTIRMPDADNISMNLWMKGSPRRTVFSALSPMTEGLSRTPDMPYDIKEQPTLTFVARQEGEAWQHPFVAVYEPSSVNEPEQIRSVTFPEVTCPKADVSPVGICVEQKDGRTDRILSSDQAETVCAMDGMKAAATYALWGNRQGQDCVLFMGCGTLLQVPGISVKAKQPISLLLEQKDGKWYCTVSGACTIVIKGKKYTIKAAMVMPEPLS
ncbi:MAG: heparinase II/III family protein [Bacteroides sp.]|nr:heparinase II/III family protein [Bacteroides sp.]